MKQVANYSSLAKLTFIFSFAAMLGLGQKAASQEVITIKQAVENTLKNNLQVKQSQFTESLSDVTLKQSKLALYPTLNAGVNQNMGWGRNQVASGLYLNTQNYNLGARDRKSVV